MLTGLSKHL